ncbi:MAG TPA: cell division ATP-binding protein FtsE [Nitrospiria bacterium]
MIQMFHVTKSYGHGPPALNDINLYVEKGEFVFIMGPSGAGKTTLLRLLFCTDRPDEGQILIHGRNVARLNGKSVPDLRTKIGFIFQDYKLIPRFTVFENVGIPLQIQGMGRGEIRRRVMDLLDWVGLEQRAKAYPRQLAGGEQQRVCIARALANEPAIILADEPTGNLDMGHSEEILGLLRYIHGRGATILMATHNQTLVAKYPKRLIHLKKGCLVGDEGPQW